MNRSEKNRNSRIILTVLTVFSAAFLAAALAAPDRERLVSGFIRINTYPSQVGSPYSPRDSQESAPTPQFKNINSSALSFLYTPTVKSSNDYWKNQSFD